MISVLYRSAQFMLYRVALSAVYRASRLPRNSKPSDVMRILRENIALKAQLQALMHELKKQHGRNPKVSLSTRAAQVLAYFLTRGNSVFHKYYLSTSLTTVERWAAKFRGRPWKKSSRKGRMPLDDSIVEKIVELKKSNGGWGAPRIKNELRKMGISVSEPTIRKVLREHGFDPIRRKKKFSWERFKSKGKDFMWAMDYFFVRTTRGMLMSVYLVIDMHTRELIELKAYNGREVDSGWTICTLHDAMQKLKRKPQCVMHDNGSTFMKQFERQLAVLDIEQRWTPARLPWVNGIAERAVKSVRMELLNHVRVEDVRELQWYLVEYQEYYNHHRTHQALEGYTPADYGNGTPIADVISIDELRARLLVEKKFAHGILNSYSLEEYPENKKAA